MIDIATLLADKSISAKGKTAALATALLGGSLTADALLAFAAAAKAPLKATCVEALTTLAEKDPARISQDVFEFALGALSSEAPRVQWEAAKLIGYSAQRFPELAGKAVAALLPNTESKGTVVRWSAAFALGEIIQLETPVNRTLLPATEAIVKREEKNSIRKIYAAALKRIEKKKK